MSVKHENQNALALMWQETSRMVHLSRYTPYPSRVNDFLRQQIKADPKGVLAPAMSLWMGDNLALEARFKEAIGTYSGLLARYPKATLAGQPLAASVLEQMALCQERVGHPDEAIKTLRKALSSGIPGLSPSWVHYRMGWIAECAGREPEAIKEYDKAAKLKDALSHNAVPIPELARRSAARLRSRRQWFRPAPEDVARLLADALERRKPEILEKLISETHFTIGSICSEGVVAHQKRALPALLDDLAESRVRVDALALVGSGGKRFLVTDGWRGKLLFDRVLFVITQTRCGWEWSGIALSTLSAAMGRLLKPAKQETNQPLEIPIKAPWPAGQTFRAGGFGWFSAESAAFAAMGLFAFVAIEAASWAPCGFGPSGLYYNQLPTHVGQDAFAIDFTRYVQGVPYQPASDGTPVLNVAYGIVMLTRGTIAHGDHSLDNRVEVGHFAGNWLERLIEAINKNPRYTSKYLHLSGPNQIPVSVGMFLKQGSRLGLMDDTGNSAWSHLHFSIHDNQLGGKSVRPNPMDGHRLDDADDSTWITSTNVPIP